jgi:hypothetical protein
MTRYQYIELILRMIYNGQPSDDSSITYNQVNLWLNQGIGIAAKKNYNDSIQLDGVAYINNSFYTTITDLDILPEPVDNVTYSIKLPQIPIALGKNEGIATVQFVGDKRTSQTGIPLSMNQVGYIENLRPIQDKILYWPEGEFVFLKATIPMSSYKATVRMVSGGDSTNLSSTLIIPDDYLPMIVEYIKAQLVFERSRPIDHQNDGVDNN